MRFIDGLTHLIHHVKETTHITIVERLKKVIEKPSPLGCFSIEKITRSLPCSHELFKPFLGRKSCTCPSRKLCSATHKRATKI
jgi:hypothetical protein